MSWLALQAHIYLPFLGLREHPPRSGITHNGLDPSRPVIRPESATQTCLQATHSIIVSNVKKKLTTTPIQQGKPEALYVLVTLQVHSSPIWNPPSLFPIPYSICLHSTAS